jgi:hypothetical protein
MAKNPAFVFQHFLNKTIPVGDEGIEIAKYIALSFPDHAPEPELNKKKRFELVRLIVGYSFFAKITIEQLRDKVIDGISTYIDFRIKFLKKQYPNHNSDTQQAIEYVDKTEPYKKKNKLWIEKVEQIYSDFKQKRQPKKQKNPHKEVPFEFFEGEETKKIPRPKHDEKEEKNQRLKRIKIKSPQPTTISRKMAKFLTILLKIQDQLILLK